MSRQHSTVYAALILVAALSVFYRLDDRVMWTDEAETALLAMNITEFGVPRVDDGLNRLDIYGVRSASDDGLWIWSPWLDEYVAAASFALLGPSTRSARLPFALAAVACVALLGLLAYRVYRDHEVAWTAMFLCATCVAFLLHSRQCRYHAILMLAQLWVVYGVHRLIVAPGVRGSLHVGFGLAAMFYCNYIALPGNLVALVLAGALWGRRHPRFPLLVAGGLGLFGALAFPWLFYAELGSQAGAFGGQHFLDRLLYYVSEIHHHAAPLLVLALPLLVLAVPGWRRHWQAWPSEEADGARDVEMLIWWIVGLQVLALALTPLRFFRYLVPLIPLLLLLVAVIVRRAVPLAPGRIAVVAVLGLTNLVSMVLPLPIDASHSADLPYVRFVRSIASDYSDRLEEVVGYLQAEGQAGETVYTPDRAFPIMFYTDMRVLDARTDRRGLAVRPEWVLPRNPASMTDKVHVRIDPGSGYRKVTLRVSKSPRDGSRPAPDAHAFFRSRETEPFQLYRRRD